jgi:hypothetical protein
MAETRSRGSATPPRERNAGFDLAEILISHFGLDGISGGCFQPVAGGLAHGLDLALFF